MCSRWINFRLTLVFLNTLIRIYNLFYDPYINVNNDRDSVQDSARSFYTYFRDIYSSLYYGVTVETYIIGFCNFRYSNSYTGKQDGIHRDLNMNTSIYNYLLRELFSLSLISQINFPFHQS